MKSDKNQFIKYNSICQFRDVIRDIRKLNIEDDITFIGTVKLHGTNAGVCFTDSSDLWVQSRKRIINPDNDNYGFAKYVLENNEQINSLIQNIIKEYNVDTIHNIISIYGEWCGSNIQANVSISGLPKMWVLFGIKIVSIINQDNIIWLDIFKFKTLYESIGILNIYDFENFKIDINFTNTESENYVEYARQKLIELTKKVENECPVGKEIRRKLAIKTSCTVGEGIVWTAFYNKKRYIFKVKGKIHSSSKVKSLAPVDVEKMKNINEFISYSVTENRMKQGIDVLFTSLNIEPTIKHIREFIQWVKNDVFKEEMDTLERNNLKVKDIIRKLNTVSSTWYRSFLDRNVCSN